MKLFVTVGTHTQPFTRLFKALDGLQEEGMNAQILGQKGYTPYAPKNYTAKGFLSEEEYKRGYEDADVVLAHAGAGTILHALALNKPLVLAPRLKRFHEHTNDHQLDLARALEKQGLLLVVEDMAELKAVIHKALAFSPPQDRGGNRLAGELRGFLLEEEKRLKGK